MRFRLASAVWLSGVILLLPAESRAQTGGLAGLLLRFFSPAGEGLDLVAGAQTTHGRHFLASQPDAQATMLLLNRGIATQLSTVPLGSSSGGFTYTFEPSVGLHRRDSESFGSLFAERALTVGRGRLAIGVTHLRSTFDSFENQGLSQGDLEFFLLHRDVNGDGSLLNPYFEGDRIRANLFLNIQSDTTVLFGSLGVTDRLDVGFALPYIRLDLQARIHLEILHFSTAPDPFAIHTFLNPDGSTPLSLADGNDEADVAESGSAEGVGDLILRAKYQLHKSGSGGSAIGIDVRIPTGDENDLLGSGANQAKLFLIASGPGPQLSPHVNAGYTFSKGGAAATGDLADEINYTAGFDAAIHRRLTVSGDVIGRVLLNAERVVEAGEVWNYVTRGELGPDGNAIAGLVRTVTLPRLQVTNGTINTVTGVLGVKLNPVRNLLISASALFSLAERGLQDRFTPVVSVDYSF